jgi:single-strand selective monofunctional uracil DNA glycosylase
MEDSAKALIQAAQELKVCVGALRFSSPVHYVYNPLEYAWNPYRSYLERFSGSRKRVLLLGMNPGPWGMAQTGVPFGDLEAVRDWMGIEQSVGHPEAEHPRRPVLGYQVDRGEVSGRRLWGLMRERFGEAEHFFRDHFVGNYCPLLFFDSEGKNITPSNLHAGNKEDLFACCDEHLRATIRALQPEWLIGIGKFAEGRLRAVQRSMPHEEGKVAGILHPSPASPAANKDWAGRTADRLLSLGVW